MRRGTPAAYEFGKILYELRKATELTLAEVAEAIGTTSGNVSFYEHGKRAVKEEKLEVYAVALGVNRTWLRSVWLEAQNQPEPPIVRNRGKSIGRDALELAIADLTHTERERVLGYIHALKESR